MNWEFMKVEMYTGPPKVQNFSILTNSHPIYVGKSHRYYRTSWNNCLGTKEFKERYYVIDLSIDPYWSVEAAVI